MNPPRIDLIPLRSAVCCDAPTHLDVLVQITPPGPQLQGQRPPLNLVLVLDRSGSMGSRNKMGFAIQAAVFAVEQLLPTDRVSVTVFDDEVKTLIPSTLADCRARITSLLREIQPGNTTALHGGWRAGADQVLEHLVPGGLNRVLLLSDGLANIGETNPTVIANDVGRMARTGVSTTTLGVGDDYNEDLMEAMAKGGDGNYYYIETPKQLADIFQSELRGLMATSGHHVSLGIEPQGDVTLVDVLNDLDRTSTGRLKLPNLIAGVPVLVQVRLHVPPVPQANESRPSALCRFRLAWDDPQSGQRQRQTAELHLPVVTALAWEELVPRTDVQEQVAVQQMARLKREAARRLESGDTEGTRQALGEARQILAAAPGTEAMTTEAQDLDQVEADLANGDRQKFAKRAKYQANLRNTSKPYE